MNQRVTQRFDVSQVHLAAELLRDGKLIAFPTETVYGLGANAWNESAIADLYAAKGRPSDNPLIVHVGSMDQIRAVARDVPETALRLIHRFWPGPLTLVLPKHRDLSSRVTGGLDSVGIRIPKHPTALALLQSAGVPVVAPSANRSGRPSATTWQSVVEDLHDRIDGVIMDAPTTIGLESTVVDLTQSHPVILRAGAISLEAVQSVVPETIEATSGTDTQILRRSPGTRHPHYQPVAKVILHPWCGDVPTQLHHVQPWIGEGLEDASRAWIGLHAPPETFAADGIPWTAQERCASVEHYAQRLYAFFREMDHAGVDCIVCESVPEDGIGRALNDRMQRAAGRA